MRTNLLVYLAGPMTGMTIEYVKEWRTYAQQRLEGAGFTVLNPARGLVFLKPEDVIEGTYDEYGENKHVVFTRDKFDSTRADVLIVNLLKTTKVSIGTMMEMAWAHLAGRFVVTVIERKDNPHMHAFVREVSCVIVEDIDAAVDYVLVTFGGG